MIVNEEECREAGLDPYYVGRIASRLESAAKDAGRMGLTVFGGTGSGDLRVYANDGKGSLICATMGGRWDGGDGGHGPSEDGLIRGETAE